MTIALLGASGHVGLRLLKELISRGYRVTAVSRNEQKIPAWPGVNRVACDVNNEKALAVVLAEHRAVISAVPFLLVQIESLLAAIKAAEVSRYLVVGGAGSLWVDEHRQLLNTPEFPAAYVAEARAGQAFLTRLRQEDDLNWTFLSPSANFFAGERTQKFRLGGEQLLVGEQGSSISFEDFAVAMVDELESNAHPRQRFTVGY